MKQIMIAMLIAGAAAAVPAAQAQTSVAAATASAPEAKPAVAKTTKKKIARKAAVPAAAVEEDEKEPDVGGTTVVDYQCELGNKLTIFQNNDDDRHVALKWGKRLHRMDRIDTTTGADRFENHHYGLVWIGIPAKGMLLDSKNGHQLANECKTATQRAPKVSEATTSAVAIPH